VPRAKPSRIGRAQEKHPGGVEPHLEQAEGRKLASFERGEIGPEPQHALLRRHADGKRHGKAARRGLIPGRGRINLVQGALLDAPLRQASAVGWPSDTRACASSPSTLARDARRNAIFSVAALIVLSAVRPADCTQCYGTNREQSQRWVLKKWPVTLDVTHTGCHLSV